MKRHLFYAILFAQFLVTGLVFPQVQAVGNEFQVNEPVTGSVLFPDTDANEDNEFIIAWWSAPSPLGGVARTFSSGGGALGIEFQVFQGSTNVHQEVSAASTPSGNYFLLWRQIGTFGTAFIKARWVSPTGDPLGGEFTVNTYTFESKANPTAAVSPSGQIVVAWEGFGSAETDTESWGIQARLFDSSGTPIGSEFQVNSYTPGDQKFPDLTFLSDDQFVVVWNNSVFGSCDSPDRGKGRLFSTVGVPLGPEFWISNNSDYSQLKPQVGSDDSGQFVVTWENSCAIPNNIVEMKRFHSDGSPHINEFQVPTYSTGLQYKPALSVWPNGRFVVVWESLGSPEDDDDSISIQGRVFGPNLRPRGGQFQINTLTTRAQQYPDVAMRTDGSFITTWRSYLATENGAVDSIQARIYVSTYIFEDGFESGDTGMWTASSP